MSFLILIIHLVFHQPMGIQRELPPVSQSERDHHAHELLGKIYSDTHVAKVRASDVRAFIYQTLQKELNGYWKRRSWAVSETLIRESQRYGLDPMFVLAVIRHESNFNYRAVGKVGELGLMQLRPHTGRWLAGLKNEPWHGNSSLLNPITNIRLGTYFLHHLRNKWESHGGFYLAAYNMGPTRLRRSLQQQVKPKEYATRVMGYYLRFYDDIRSQVLGSEQFAQAIPARNIAANQNIN